MSENGKLSKFWIQELTRPAFEDWITNEPSPVVIIGIGAIEQHGPHLPLGTDSLGARIFIHEVAKRTNSVCIHPSWAGYSPHHMGFKGTVTFSDETFKGILMDTIGSFAEHGIKRFLLVNHHGGNRNIMNLVIQLAQREYNVMVTAPTGPSKTELAKEIQYRMEKYNERHSGPRETAYALENFPDLVEMWRLDDWEPTFSVDSRLMEFMDPDREDYELVSQLFRTCRGYNTDQFTSSGVYSTTNPKDADPEEAKKSKEERIQFLVDFINLWKTIPIESTPYNQ
jgi:creatinine amidohydrolase